MCLPPPSVEVLLSFCQLLLSKMCFLEKQDVFPFGPDPVLYSSSERGHIGKDKMQNLRVMPGLLGLTRSQGFNGVRHQLPIAVEGQPDLNDLSAVEIGEVLDGDGKGLVIGIPVCIVQGHGWQRNDRPHDLALCARQD